MTTRTGALTVSDLNSYKFTSATEFGLDRLYEILAADLTSYNTQVREMLGDFAEMLDVQARAIQLNSGVAFTEADEFGVPKSEKDFGYYEVAFPLRKFIAGLGWTREYFSMATPSEVSAKYDAVLRADSANLVKWIKKSIFEGSNYTFVNKHDGTNTSLTVRKFWNGDGTTLPTNTSGSSFATTHTHYLYVASAGTPVNADIDGLVNTIREHDQNEGIRIYTTGSGITQLAAISSTKFKALRSDFINYVATDNTRLALDPDFDVSNYLAGYWDGLYPVWVKPWAISGYFVAMATGVPNKPLGYRESKFASMQGLKLDAQYDVAPMITQTATRYGGFGVNNRSAGAVLYTLSNSAYTDPTIT